MEQFKVCEKETKTKAYSKEGLLLQNTVDDAKVEVRGWIVKSLASLNTQIDTMEAEFETIKAKKKKSKEETQRSEHLEKWVERHKHHNINLERVLRMLDNETLAPSKVEELKDGLEYYIDNNQDADFVEDEMLYESIGLKELTPGQIEDEDEDISGSEITSDSDLEDKLSDSNDSSSSASLTSTQQVESKAPPQSPVIKEIVKKEDPKK